MLYFDLAYLAVFAASWLCCAGLIAMGSAALMRRTGDRRAVQAAHINPTPRVGGLAVFLGLMLALVMVPSAHGPLFSAMLISVLPAFVAGLLEDLGFGLSPRKRLVAAAMSSLLAIWLFGAWVARADVPGADMLLGFAPVAIAFTLFATAGVSHAFNLIDGLNGLSAATGILTALGLAALAHQTGQPGLVALSLAMIAALMGFLVFNFPMGRIFLGDAGAYGLGHILAWISVLLMFHAPDVSPWAVVLIFFWPLADTGFAIYRRRASGLRTDAPDRLHFHQMVMRLLEIRYLGRARRELSNPLATLVMLPFITAPVAVGVLLWNAPALAFAATLGFAALFVGSYVFCIRHAWSWRPVRTAEPVYILGPAE